jgi:transposase
VLVVNFAHPLTEAQRGQIAALIGRPVERVLDVPAHCDPAVPLAGQVRALIERANLAPGEWQTAALVVNLPSLGVIAAAVLAELHGRTGHFPAVLRLRPAAGTVPTAYEVAEVVDLQALRDAARVRRADPA